MPSTEARIASLNEQVATYTQLIDEALAEGDEARAESLAEAVDRFCDELDALATQAA